MLRRVYENILKKVMMSTKEDRGKKIDGGEIMKEHDEKRIQLWGFFFQSIGLSVIGRCA